MPVGELGFRIDVGSCQGCHRFPHVSAVDINGEKVEEDRHCCGGVKSAPDRPPSARILNNYRDATAFIKLAETLKDFGDKSLDANHGGSFAKWHGPAVQKIREEYPVRRLPYGYAVEGMDFFIVGLGS